MFIPEHYAALNPYIVASDAGTYLQFLASAFGAVEEGRSVVPGGRLAPRGRGGG